jgi:hypothetical protein
VVRQSIAEGDTGKIDLIVSAYGTVLSDPAKALDAMTPNSAAGMSALVAQYLRTQIN